MSSSTTSTPDFDKSFSRISWESNELWLTSIFEDLLIIEFLIRNDGYMTWTSILCTFSTNTYSRNIEWIICTWRINIAVFTLITLCKDAVVNVRGTVT